MLGLEGAWLGVLGVLSGALLGGVVGLILIYVVNRQSFHWSMDLHIPYALLALLGLVLIVAAAVISMWSGRGAMSNAMIRAVKEDW
jgi:putative ABC transport system permease protein